MSVHAGGGDGGSEGSNGTSATREDLATQVRHAASAPAATAGPGYAVWLWPLALVWLVVRC